MSHDQGDKDEDRMEPMSTARRRPLGTMIAYGFPRGDVAIDLALAVRLGASRVEALPDWREYPDPIVLKVRAADLGLSIHSAHACWGGRAIAADRVDLGSTDPAVARASRDDLKRCVDWLVGAGGTCLIVHPGGLSDPDEAPFRRDSLSAGLLDLADHALGSGVTLCVENMPPGVHPGSRMGDLAALVAELDRPEIALALDTGHAHLGEGVETETLAAGRWLKTTHVHDNADRKDAHLPPGLGTIDWALWRSSLDAIDYQGVIMLECIRALREVPSRIDDSLLALLDLLCSETDTENE
jgi:sugar phosphate isomerase/epimerase